MELSKAHFRTMPDAESKQLFIDFVKLVRSMRDKQKEYFKKRKIQHPSSHQQDRLHRVPPLG